MVTKAQAVAVAAALVIGGCLPGGKTDIRQASKDAEVRPAGFTPPDGTITATSRLIAPKRCRVSVATLSRPVKERALNAALWGVADEGIVPLELRNVLAANGLRVGLIRGSLPAEVEALMKAAPPQPKAEVVEIDQPDGEPTTVELSASEGATSLLLSREGRAFGRDYDQAKGSLRVTATRDDSGGVRVKVIPEIRHGPMRDAYQAAPSVGAFQPQEFLRRRGQAEESFRDLTMTVNLKPGQVLAVGGAGDPAAGLGGFLFNKADPNSDRVEQRVVLLWAKPTGDVPSPKPPRR